MARITVEDCLEKVSNRFALILLASKRTKQLLTGSKLTISEKKENKPVVNSLREIAEGLVRFKTEEDLQKEREAALKKREEELALAEAAEAASNGSSELSGAAVEAGESSGDDESDGEESEEGSESESLLASH